MNFVRVLFFAAIAITLYLFIKRIRPKKRKVPSGKTGFPTQIKCNDGTIRHCAAGTRWCFDNSPQLCKKVKEAEREAQGKAEAMKEAEAKFKLSM